MMNALIMTILLLAATGCRHSDEKAGPGGLGAIPRDRSLRAPGSGPSGSSYRPGSGGYDGVVGDLRNFSEHTGNLSNGEGSAYRQSRRWDAVGVRSGAPAGFSSGPTQVDLSTVRTPFNPGLAGSEYGSAVRLIGAMRDSKPNPSRSKGSPSNGLLTHGMMLPAKGYGFEYVHAGKRRAHYGTDEMVLGLMQLGADMKKTGHPGIRVGDLSLPGGGEIGGHVSHEAGRDVDIIFLAMDKSGNPVDQKSFISYDSRGRHGSVYFDSARNWELLAKMIESPYWNGRIQLILLDRNQRAQILNYGKALAAKAEGGERARALRLTQTMSGLLHHWDKHRDHFHLRLKPDAPRSRAVV